MAGLSVEKNLKNLFWLLFGISAVFLVICLIVGASNVLNFIGLGLLIVSFIGLVIGDRRLKKESEEAAKPESASKNIEKDKNGRTVLNLDEMI